MKIGLTGGIGSGKSTVAGILQDLGAVIVDADAISRSLTAVGGAALPALAAVFGASIIGTDGALDRARMRELAFKDPHSKQQLEAVLHPLIGAITHEQAAAAGDKTVVFDVPLLTESSRWRARVDRILVVDCTEATQLQRVLQRSGWDEATARRVIAQQASRAQRRAIADAVIVNDGLALDALRAELHSLWNRWCPA